MRFRSLVGGLWIRITAAALQTLSSSSRLFVAAERLPRMGCSVSSITVSDWRRCCSSSGTAGGKTSSASQKGFEAACRWRTKRGVDIREVAGEGAEGAERDEGTAGTEGENAERL